MVRKSAVGFHPTRGIRKCFAGDGHLMQDLRSEHLLALPGRHLLTPSRSLAALFPIAKFISLLHSSTICTYLGLMPCLLSAPPERQLLEKGSECCPGHHMPCCLCGWPSVAAPCVLKWGLAGRLAVRGEQQWSDQFWTSRAGLERDESRVAQEQRAPGGGWAKAT